VERLATDARPTLAELPSTLPVASSALREIGGLSRQDEFPRMLRLLRPVTSDLPPTLEGLRPVAKLTAPLADCLSTHVLPVLNTTLSDGPNSTNEPVWRDLVHAGTALSGGSPNFDGNGTTIRLGVTESENALADPIPNIGQLSGAGAIEGVSPVPLPGYQKPAARPDQPCADQKLPNFNLRKGGPPTNMVRLPARKAPDLSRYAAIAGSKSQRHALLRTLLGELAPKSAAKSGGHGRGR
jgi:hypothetical protein